MKFTDTFREGEDMVTLLKVDPEMRFFNLKVPQKGPLMHDRCVQS